MSRYRHSPPDISVNSMQKRMTWIFQILFLILLFELKKKKSKNGSHVISLRELEGNWA